MNRHRPAAKPQKLPSAPPPAPPTGPTCPRLQPRCHLGPPVQSWLLSGAPARLLPLPGQKFKRLPAAVPILTGISHCLRVAGFLVCAPPDPPDPQQERSGEKLPLSVSHTFPREAPVPWKSSVPFDEPTEGLRGRWACVWGRGVEGWKVPPRSLGPTRTRIPVSLSYLLRQKCQAGGEGAEDARSCVSHPRSPRIRGGAAGANPGRLRGGGGHWAGLGGSPDRPTFEES